MDCNRCDNCKVKMFSFILNFFNVLIAVAGALLLFYNLIGVGGAYILSWIILGIAVAVAIVFLCYVLFKCLKGCHGTQHLLCKYSWVIALGILGAIVLSILAIVIILFPGAVWCAILFGLMLFFFGLMIANILVYSYGVSQSNCEDDDDHDCCHHNCGCSRGCR